MLVKGKTFDLVNAMKIKAIKRGQTIELLEPINISDGEIIIDIDEQQSSDVKPNFWEALQEFRQQVNLEELEIEPEEIFAGLRDKSPGRDVIL
ncbi:hypothetical protein Cri9333_3092 [Crinalium epipsammum PCC 9333]|uniref:Uncharacterized protein n=1 Tax=Crinalium epipsammum PCC 9333 TaxID=1173022 RepID=K9W131_9CYAN|nr:hypothetical protein [Crinalium epipsammum]AFZ13931.1 hypothetical protein Cri9333_3092 [Crinalium epipsammum PCC 9333]